MFKIKLITIIFLINIFCINTAKAANPIPYKGRINGSRVNIRGSHTTTSQVLTQLKKGQDVTVIEEKEGWSKIVMPYGIATWVYAPLIKDNLVNRDTVNVRAGAATHYATLAKLKRGDVVEIIDEADGWVKITPPANVGGWVSSQYVTFLASVSNYEKWLEGEKEAKNEFAVLEEFRKKEMFKPIEEVDFNLIIKKYVDFAKKYKNYPESDTAKDRIDDAESKKKMAVKSGTYVEHSAPVSTTSISTTENIEATQNQTANLKLSFTGKIKKLKKEIKGANYLIKTGGFFGGKKYYLVTNDFNLAKYINKKVTIIGYKLDDEKQPLINVTEIAEK